MAWEAYQLRRMPAVARRWWRAACAIHLHPPRSSAPTCFHG